MLDSAVREEHHLSGRVRRHAHTEMGITVRILIIEDDFILIRLYEAILQVASIELEIAMLGSEGIERALHRSFDLILLDLGLPDLSGLEVLKSIRDAEIDTPIMIVSGEIDIATKVTTFAGGADEYLTKPFQRDELLARIEAVRRRSEAHTPATIEFGRFILHLEEQIVRIDGRKICLTTHEYRVLECLALRKGSAVTKEGLMGYLYKGADTPVSKIVDVFVCRLRKKLAAVNGGTHYIETERGVGYALREPKQRVAA